MVKEKAPKKSQAVSAVKKVTKTASKLKAAPKKEKAVPPTEPSEEKQEIITQFQVKQGDTGSPEVQIALLTKRIEKLVGHLKTNPADNHSRRGLLGIVSKRRRLLKYLEKRDDKRYKAVTAKLGLEK